MLKRIESIKAQAERDLLYAEAKIEVCNTLINECMAKDEPCAEETENAVDTDIFGSEATEYIVTANN